MVRSLVVAAVVMVAAPARADRDLCTPGAKFRGTPIDLDVKQADVRDALRLVAEMANVNLVAGDGVDGKVTISLKHVAWETATCSIAALLHLRVTVQDNIILVRRRG